MRTLILALLPTTLLACSPVEASLKSSANGSSDGLVLGEDGGSNGSDGSDGSDGADGGGDGGDGGTTDHPYAGAYEGGSELGLWIPAYDWGPDCSADATAQVQADGAFSATTGCSVEMGRGAEIDVAATWYGTVSEAGDFDVAVTLTLDQDGNTWEEYLAAEGWLSDDGGIELYYEEGRVYGSGRDETEVVFWGYVYAE